MEITKDHRKIYECWQVTNGITFSFAADGRVVCSVDDLYGTTVERESEISKDDMRVLGAFLFSASNV